MGLKDEKEMFLWVKWILEGGCHKIVAESRIRCQRMQ